MKFNIFFAAVFCIFSWFAWGCQQQVKTLPQCNLKKMNKMEGAVRGEGKTSGSALESVIVKLKLNNEFNDALSLWRDQDRVLPLQKNGKEIAREVVFSDLSKQYFLLNKGCQIKYVCKKDGMVRTGVECSGKVSFEARLKKLFAIIDNKIDFPLWAKIKVVTGNLGGKATKQDQILAQSIENVIYKYEKNKRLKLVKYLYPQQYLWDLLPFNLDESSRAYHTNAHYYFWVKIKSSHLHWSLYQLFPILPGAVTKNYFWPQKLSQGELKITKDLAEFFKGKSTVNCKSTKCQWNLALKNYLEKKTREKSLVSLLKLCKQSYGPACFHLSGLILATLKYDNSKMERTKKIDLLQTAKAKLNKSCKQGFLPACTLEVESDIFKNTIAKKGQKISGTVFKKRMTKICHRGEPQACIKRARMESPKGLVLKNKLYLKACNLGSSRGCAETGCKPCAELRLSKEGKKLEDPGPWKRFKDRIRLACNRGRPEGCIYQGAFFEKVTDKQKALFSEKACMWGAENNTCAFAGKNNMSLNVSNYRAGRSRKIYNYSCRAQNFENCMRFIEIEKKIGNNYNYKNRVKTFSFPQLPAMCLKMGKLYWEGVFVNKDLEMAKEYFLKVHKAKKNKFYRKKDVIAGRTYLAYINFTQAKNEKEAQKNKEELEKYCKAKNGSACYFMGKITDQGTEDKNKKKARTFYQQACNLNNPPSCRILANEKLLEKKDLEFVKLMQKACEGGDRLSCKRALKKMTTEPKFQNKIKLIASIAEKGCKLNEFYSCELVSRFLDKFTDVPKKLWLRYLEKSCIVSMRQPEFCKIYAQKANISLSEVEEMLSGECDLGNQFACVTLGSLYEDKHKKNKKPEKALKLYKNSCDAGFGKGCLSYGYFYFTNQKFKDVRTALKYYRKSCTYGDHVGCNNYAYVLFWEVKKPEEAYKYVRKSCAMGYVTACENIGNFSIVNDVFNKNSKTVENPDFIKYLRLACFENKGGSCFSLGRWYRDNKGKNHQTLALKYLKRACTLGYKYGCIFYKKLKNKKSKKTKKTKKN